MNRNIKMKNEKEEKKHGRRRKGPAVDVGVPAREICEVVEVVKPSCPVDATGAPAHRRTSCTARLAVSVSSRGRRGPVARLGSTAARPGRDSPDSDRSGRYPGPEEKTGSRTAMTSRIWVSRSGSHTSSRPSLRRHAAHLGCDAAP